MPSSSSGDAVQSLITASFSQEDADTFTSYTPSDADIDALAQVGRDVLAVFRPIPGACMVMSALYSVMLERLVKQKAYVVAGSLYVGDVRIFGEDGGIDGKNRFSKSDVSWDGHGWVVLGDRIADVSLFRTARSGKSHPILASYVAAEFGPNTGLLICRDTEAGRGAFRFEPRYVLSQDQVDALARGAKHIIESG